MSMPYRLACLALALLLGWPLLAQEGPRFGAHAILGLNAAQIDGDNAGGYNRLGLCAGLAGTLRLRGRWSASLELLYSQKGSRAEAGFGNGNELLSIRLDYVEIPLLLHFREADIQFEAGLSYGRLLSAYSLIGASECYFPAREGFPECNYRRHDASLLAGLRYHLSPQWAISARAGRSLTNLVPSGTNADPLNGHWLGFALRYGW